MKIIFPVRETLRFPGLVTLCICLSFLLSPERARADIDPSSKVEDMVANAASSFKTILANAEKRGGTLLFADAVLQGKIWLLRKEFRGLMNKRVKDLGAEKKLLLHRVDKNLKALRSQLQGNETTTNTDVQRLSAAIHTALMAGIGPSPVKVLPRMVEPVYGDGKIRIRVSGIELNGGSLALKLREGGVSLPPSREVDGSFEFDILRADLPPASRKIKHISVSVVIEEDISIRGRIEKLFSRDSKNRIEKLFSKDSTKRSFPVVLSLLPDHIGTVKIYGLRSSGKLSGVRDLKTVEDSITSVGETRKKLICVTADRGCEIDKQSIRYEITGWNAYYQTEYCDNTCQQPLPYSRPEGNSRGTCPRIRLPGGSFKTRQTQSCQGNRFEVDKTEWTAKKACVALVSRPLLRGVRARASGKIGGKQNCLGRDDQRILLTRRPLRIDWTGEKVVEVPRNYGRIMVELTTADGKKELLTHGSKKHQFIDLLMPPRSRVARLRPRGSFWWR